MPLSSTPAFLSPLSWIVLRRRCGHRAAGRCQQQCHGFYDIWLAEKKRSSRRIRPLNVPSRNRSAMLRLPRLPRKETRKSRRGANLAKRLVPADRPAREVFFGAYAGVAQPASKPHTGGPERSWSASNGEWKKLAAVANCGSPVRERARERFALREKIGEKTGDK